MQKPERDFLTLISAPARRALQNEGIKSLKKLSNYLEEELLKLHGLGPSTIPKLKSVLKQEGFKNK